MEQPTKKKYTFKEIIIIIYQTLVIGVRNTLKTGWFITKIIVPITFVIKLLQHLELLQYITFIFEPMMKLFGLPGDAVLVLLSSYFINIYAGLAVMSNLQFTVKEINVLAIMILLSHSLLVETSVIKALGIPRYKQLLVRIGSSFIAGIVLSLAIGNQMSDIVVGIGGVQAEFAPFSVQSFSLFFLWLKDLIVDFGLSALSSIYQMMIIIGLVLIGIEFLKVTKLLDRLNNILFYLTKFLGIRKQATTPLFVGMFIGITYGAGAILMSYKNNEMNRKDVLLVSLFLCLAHALIEDTLLFAKMGANILIILLGRLILAISVVFITSRVIRLKYIHSENEKIDAA